MKYFISLFSIVLSILLLSSCKKDDETTTIIHKVLYTIPSEDKPMRELDCNGCIIINGQTNVDH